MKTITHIKIGLTIALIAFTVFLISLAYWWGEIRASFDCECNGKTSTSVKPAVLLEQGGSIPLDTVGVDTHTLAVATSSYPEMVDYYCAKYLIPTSTAQRIKEVIACESSWDSNAVGQTGEIGLAQFKKITFNQWKNYYGLSELNIYDPESQIKLMVLMFGDGQQKNWSCYYKIINNYVQK